MMFSIPLSLCIFLVQTLNTLFEIDIHTNKCSKQCSKFSVPVKTLFHDAVWDSPEIITSSIQFQHIRQLAAYLLHRCMFHWLANTGHHSYNCSGRGNPFRMCRTGRDVSISSHPSQACTHTPLSRDDTCNAGRQHEARSIHFNTCHSVVREYPVLRLRAAVYHTYVLMHLPIYPYFSSS
jgi:hypothetical protein